MEKLINAVNTLRSVVKTIDFKTKNKLIGDRKELKELLFDRPPYHYSVLGELKLFEKKFKVELSDELKLALEIVGNRGYEHSELFDYNRPLGYNVSAFFSEKLVRNLIEKGVYDSDLGENYYDTEFQKFNSNKIEAVYESFVDKTDLLIYYIPFHECCGGRKLLILNGSDKNKIAYDNHGSYRELTIDGKRYDYETYLFSDVTETIFDLMEREVLEVTEYLNEQLQIVGAQ